ncbi:MAG: hypothetical protein FJ224_06165 [Lentisphaerae bacterium]|nr:hypothetical protein [Lentisphaerota bacterium]
MQIIGYNGWGKNARLSNGEMDLVITLDVGPRILRCGFVGGRNVFAEIDGQQGCEGEKEWMIRGGHRLWVAPEAKPQTYELDNVPVEVEEIRNGVRTIQKPGSLTKIRKTMEITLDPNRNRVRIEHILRNTGRSAKTLSPWALSVMAPGGKAFIPMPGKIPHTKCLTHNQEWSIWAYTDFSDPRWTIGSRYIIFRQDRRRGPNKLGIQHREGWIAYQLRDVLFVKYFTMEDGREYPDGGVNFETFSNEQFLELESLGPMVVLKPGAEVRHEEVWRVFKGVPACRTESDIDRVIRPLAQSEFKAGGRKARR